MMLDVGESKGRGGFEKLNPNSGGEDKVLVLRSKQATRSVLSSESSPTGPSRQRWKSDSRRAIHTKQSSLLSVPMNFGICWRLIVGTAHYAVCLQ